MTRLPSEQSEVQQLRNWLDRRSPKPLWRHDAAGGRRSKRSGQALKAAGAGRGWPDVWVYDAPPAHPHTCGTVVEVKRVDGGGTPKDHLQEQCEKLEQLAARGWVAAIAWGWREAANLLRELGY